MFMDVLEAYMSSKTTPTQQVSKWLADFSATLERKDTVKKLCCAPSS